MQNIVYRGYILHVSANGIEIQDIWSGEVVDRAENLSAAKREVDDWKRAR